MRNWRSQQIQRRTSCFEYKFCGAKLYRLSKTTRILKMSPQIFLLTCLAVVAAVPATAAKTSDPFYVIAHMVNTRYSLDWAVQQGANAIENDIKFDKSGKPHLFEHGGFCDCSCPHPTAFHICSAALGNKCSARVEAASHLRHLAKLPGIALVIMDSKVSSKWALTKLRTSGINVVKLLEDNLFGQGYQGNVVISAAKITCYDYVYAAAAAAAGTSNKDRYYFSFDQEGNNYHDVAAMLSRFTKHRVFATGRTSCVPALFQDAYGFTSGMASAVNGTRAGQLGMSYVWIIDRQSAMESYIDMGVQGIITNRVGLLKSVATAKGLRLAKPGDKIPVASRDVASEKVCDCNYRSGGCVISSPASVGQACRCKYRGFWSCSGISVACDLSQGKCLKPDLSMESCQLGGGDCKGYRGY